jgi:hypothetical protein
VIAMPPTAPPTAPSDALPDPDDTLAVPHFEGELLDRLLERRRSGAWPRPARRAPRPPRWAVAAAAAVAVLAGGLAVARAGDDDGDRGRPDVDTAASDPTDDQTLDSIAAAVDGAIADGMIVHLTHDDVSEAWVDLRSGAERRILPASTGGRTMDWGRSEAPAAGTDQPSRGDDMPRRLVDHCLHQYADRREADLYYSDVVSPLSEELAAGAFTVDGTVTVDGRELLRLVPVEVPLETTGDPVDDDELMAVATIGTQIVYVDPATYLPVRIEDQRASASPEDGVPTSGSSAPSSNTYLEFLPRTPANLELLVPPVPAGYTQVDQLALDEERAAGCVG